MQLNDLEKLVKLNLPDANTSMEEDWMSIQIKRKICLVEPYKGGYLVHHRGPYSYGELLSRILLHFQPEPKETNLSFKEAMELASTIGIKNEKEGLDCITIELEDGSELIFESTVDEGEYSHSPSYPSKPTIKRRTNATQ